MDDWKNRAFVLKRPVEEYLMYCLETRLVNEDSLERVLSRLERVSFSVDNTLSGDAQASPIRVPGNVRQTTGMEVIVNEKKTKESSKFYFEDEVIFHELTHSVSGIYEQFLEKLVLWYDFDKLLVEKFHVSQKEVEEIRNDPHFRQMAYTWSALDEFVAQYVAQELVSCKYKSKDIYFDKPQAVRQSDPTITVYNDFADYHELHDLVVAFIKPIYGDDVRQFVIDSLSGISIDKIYDFYSKRPNGFNEFVSLFGDLGNVTYSVICRNFTESQLATDKDRMARDPKRVYECYNRFMNTIDSILGNKNNLGGYKKW